MLQPTIRRLKRILHGGEVQPALTGRDLLDVGGPHEVRRRRAKVTPDEVAEGLHAFHAHCAALTTPTPVRALQAGQRHQPRDALLPDMDPLAAQHRMHPRAAVAATARAVNRTDPLGQPRVAQLTV
jgi:hypothetical protein